MTEKEHWHLDKRLNVGHLMTTLSVAGGMIMWAMTMENRIAEHEIKIANNAKEIEHAEQRASKSFERVYNLVSKINDKIDRLIERR